MKTFNTQYFISVARCSMSVVGKNIGKCVFQNCPCFRYENGS